jgi:hypothetical protein
MFFLYIKIPLKEKTLILDALHLCTMEKYLLLLLITFLRDVCANRVKNKNKIYCDVCTQILDMSVKHIVKTAHLCENVNGTVQKMAVR